MYLQRLKELKEAGPAQRADLQRLQDMCSALTQDQEALRASIDRAEKLHGNLQSRCAASLAMSSAAMICALRCPSRSQVLVLQQCKENVEIRLLSGVLRCNPSLEHLL